MTHPFKLPEIIDGINDASTTCKPVTFHIKVQTLCVSSSLSLAFTQTGDCQWASTASIIYENTKLAWELNGANERH
jgi:hypothetical protein